MMTQHRDRPSKLLTRCTAQSRLETSKTPAFVDCGITGKEIPRASWLESSYSAQYDPDSSLDTDEIWATEISKIETTYRLQHARGKDSSWVFLGFKEGDAWSKNAIQRSLGDLTSANDLDGIQQTSSHARMRPKTIIAA
jgi:hypothetical protein